MKKEDQNGSGEYEKSYGGSSYNKDERSHYTIRKEETAPPKARREETVPPKAMKEETIPPRDAGSVSEETPEQQTAQKMKRAKTIYKKLFMAWLFLFLLSNVFSWIWNDDSSDEDVQSEETMDDPWGWDDMDDEEETIAVIDSVAATDVPDPPVSESVNPDLKDKAETAPKEKDETALKEKDGNISDDDLSTLEALERRNHEEVVREAKRAGVSTEGTTLEIMERINHAEVVKEAKRAGVSTEGTTLEIMERINRAEVVKEAKRAGVSTEGTTLEIMERIGRKEMDRKK